MNNTIVINLFAGSGAGKSTTAAGLFYKMKLKGLNVELVTEFVKHMAWDGIKPGPFDQPYIFGQQVKYESRLYGKVDYVVTDSPLLLSPIYEEYYSKKSIILESVHNFLNKSREKGVKHENFFLVRKKPFNSTGRFENEIQAKEIDNLIKTRLVEWEIPYYLVDKDDDHRVDFILDSLKI